MIDYQEIDTFSRELKKLLKKYPSLKEDIQTVKKNVIELFHVLGIDNNSTKLVPHLYHEKVGIYKIKKFSCKSLKGKGCRSGIRIIYAFFSNENKVEFLEIYYKVKNYTDMDYDQAKKYLKSFQ